MSYGLQKSPRPVLRYHGGKLRLRNWVIAHFPAHRKYTEAFGGAASVLMGKPRVYAEILGDLDDEVLNVFRVLQNRAQASELKRVLRLTPYARAEFELGYQPSDEPIEQARRTIIKSFMGYGSNAVLKASPNCGMRTRSSTWRAPTTGFRSDSNRSGTTPAHDWASYQRHNVAHLISSTSSTSSSPCSASGMGLKLLLLKLMTSSNTSSSKTRTASACFVK